MAKIASYIASTWASRYFWSNLALSDLRSRWRGSRLGVFWSVLQPMGFAALISIVFSRLLSVDLVAFVPYVLSGVLFWECFSFCITGGALANIQAAPYIKQKKLPLVIYSLRVCLVGVVTFALSSVTLLAWLVFALPQNIGVHLLALVAGLLALFSVLWPAASILSLLTPRYRDIQHALNLLLQALWFASPVYFTEDMFRNGGLHVLVDFNPIYHLLELFRDPILRGVWPDIIHFYWSICSAALLAVVCMYFHYKLERRTVFFL
ncbi:ABC transporter permease [Luminiphilus sp.]|nr:ABC transporter permease [Luminiphilus sp.]